MSLDFEDHYLDVLQNIEAAIVDVYREQPELTDHQVDKALSGLVRVYQAQANPRPVPQLTFKPLEQEVFDAIKFMCDWRLGKLSPEQEEDILLAAVAQEPKTTDDILACLKRIRKSVRLWTKQGGRQGYLSYVTSFFGE